MNPVLLMHHCLGLNTRLDPMRVPFDAKSGGRFLTSCGNVVLEDSGRVSRVAGFVRQATVTGIHSLFRWQEQTFCVEGSTLCQLNADYTRTALASITPTPRMAFVGVEDRVYYSSEFDHGYVREGVAHTWEEGTYAGPPTTHVWDSPPFGHVLAYWQGYLLVGSDKYLLHSVRWDWGRFDLDKQSFAYESRLRGVWPVVDGLFVSDSNSIYFLSGPLTDLRQLREVRVTEYPAHEGTGVEVSVSHFSPEGEEGTCWLLSTAKGLCSLLPGGRVLNLTKDNIDMPDATRGCAVLWHGRYIVCLEE